MSLHIDENCQISRTHTLASHILKMDPLTDRDYSAGYKENGGSVSITFPDVIEGTEAYSF
jgi:hypothetical protein